MCVCVCVCVCMCLCVYVCITWWKSCVCDETDDILKIPIERGLSHEKGSFFEAPRKKFLFCVT